MFEKNLCQFVLMIDCFSHKTATTNLQPIYYFATSTNLEMQTSMVPKSTKRYFSWHKESASVSEVR